MGVINLPAITVPAGKSVVLTMEMTPDVAELELSNVHITFYDLEDGRSVAVENPEKFIYFKDAVEYTRKTVENDFETFAGVGDADLSDNPTVPSSPLTQGQKQKMVTITFSPEEVSSAKIKLQNTGSGTATFTFFMAPMVKCVPCDPPCPDFAPTEIAQTTTVTTTVSETTVTEREAEKSGDTSQYECCFIGIEAIGIAVICGTDKPWFKPWCPDPPASTVETGEYKCCVVGGILCSEDKPVWKPWCADPPARRL